MTPADLHNLLGQVWQKRKYDFEQDLRPAYESYTHLVSEKDVASSLQSCVMLMCLCAAFPARQVLDMGSGFSSYVLRFYARKYQPDLKVCSIDTEKYWLDRSKDFVIQNQLEPEGFFTWEQAENLEIPCELIFFDIDDYPRRQEFLPQVIKQFCATEAKILLDDMHWPRYRHAISELLWQRDHTYLNLEKETRDEFGRFAGLICGLAQA